MAERGRKVVDTATGELFRPEQISPPAKPKKGKSKGGSKALKAQRLRRARALRWVASVFEVAALAVIGLLLVLSVLGRSANRFAGDSLVQHVVPLALSVLGLSLALVLGVVGWLWARPRIVRRTPYLPAMIAVATVAMTLWTAKRPQFEREVEQVRALVGGSAAAERAAIGHQIFAAYRRADQAELLTILERGVVYEPVIREAAQAFGVDAEVLMGIAATESSFFPRPSKDGGSGLFQITHAPRQALDGVREKLGTQKLDPVNQRHNAFLGAATLRVYHAQMHGDLFLGLLAYNIGPQNGGLASIMQQYGAKDFVTIQPYLQNLPRDYPVRVLSAALAYRVWKRAGKLPRYEEGDNATRIQAIGIPGFDRDVPTVSAAH